MGVLNLARPSPQHEPISRALSSHSRPLDHLPGHQVRHAARLGLVGRDFNELTAGVCRRLLSVAHAEDTHVCVPLQGSGTYAVEAALATLLPWDGKTLVLMNGAYGQRMARILQYLGRDFETLDMGDYLPPPPERVEAMLAADPEISHVAVVHCETSSGILNPLEAIAEVTGGKGGGCSWTR
jgi:2-aminoethylphosphonate-pyruvate transaminase